MTWPEAEAALASGAPVRRQEWADGWILSQEGERLVLRHPLPGETRQGKRRGNAGRTYTPSMEAMKAGDWMVQCGASS